MALDCPRYEDGKDHEQCHVDHVQVEVELSQSYILAVGLEVRPPPVQHEEGAEACYETEDKITHNSLTVGKALSSLSILSNLKCL